MVIREIEYADAAAFMELVQQVESESEYMLYEGGERPINLEKQQRFIQAFQQQERSTILIAEDNNKLIGYLIVIGNDIKRTKHSVQLVIGILREFRGKGIGTSLFEKLFEWGGKRGILRYSLSVVCDNTVAVALYKKMGFEIEGTKKNSLWINDRFFDEFYMCRLISVEAKYEK